MGINRETSQAKFFQDSSSEDKLAGVHSLTGNHQLTMWVALNVFEKVLDKRVMNTYSPTTVVEPITSEEADIVHFVGGFVIKKLWAKCSSAEQQEILTSFITDSEPEHSTLLAAKSHGKLTNITSEAKCMFTEMEQVFREIVAPSARNPSVNEASYHKACQCNQVIQDCFHSSTHDKEDSKSKETALIKIISLYFKVRVHHKCKLHVDRIRARNRTSSKDKALRSKLAK